MDEELRTILVSAVILGFVFSFDEITILSAPLVFIGNLIKFFILSLIALFIHNKVQKYYALKVGATTKISLWKSRLTFRFFYFEKKLTNLPYGAIYPVLVTLLSRGQIFFAATTTTEEKVVPAYRLGRRYLKLAGFERAKIAVIAPLTHIIIAIILRLIDIPILNDFALVNSMMAISAMLPLPGLLGSTVFFESKPLYIFSAVFILISALLLNFLTGISTLIVAAILAVAALLTYFWRFYTK